jgi:hypothetical protein
MRKLILIAAVALLAFVQSALAAVDYSSPNVDPRGICEDMYYAQTDYLGQIIGTIPCSNPGPSNAWVGQIWVNGELILFKNVLSTVSTQLFRINPLTGAIIATATLSFNGYVMDAAYDGNSILVCQWSPVNVIHRITLTGAEISSFVPVTGGYSARCINWGYVNWEDPCLWVGCDSSGGVTKLIKMTPQGTNLQEWQTGSVVGWYMGGEFGVGSTNANLYVVDNMGNTIKRLNLGTSITIADQANSPASSPDVAEGLCCQWDALWHNGAYASLGLIWKLNSGFWYSPPIISVTLTPVAPPIILPASGGSFSFTATFMHVWPSPTTVWGRMKYPDGTFTSPTLGPVIVNSPQGVTISRVRSQTMPADWPWGDYVYYLYANQSFSYPAEYYAVMNVSKLGTADDDSWIPQTPCTNEPFPGERSQTAFIPSGLTLAVSPNPFNPTTTISYELRASSYVSLKVYDNAGRLVTILVDGWREAGTHQVTFDGSKLPSGLYIVRMQAGEFNQTGKMMLIK